MTTQPINDGGSAFPRPASIGNNYLTGESGVVVDPQRGMSLRDWFAGQALAGELASQDGRSDAYSGKGTGIVTRDCMHEFSVRCYRIADAMLRARSEVRDA